jgi:anaerobic selenocysteine-containing dehydrogenase
MSEEKRREFLISSAKLLVGTAALGSVAGVASASSHGGSEGKGMVIDASAENTCGTCMYWGGMRKASKDGSKVVAQSMGWCNNPDSMNYRKLTSADHVMKKTGRWKKWPVL